ncbi:MAG: winged helix-turn-helix transcriptional regulator [Acidimicrobiales bacterium]
MGSSYHQFCPVSKAMELLDERWTMLVVRELVTGGQRFNDLRRGLPKMSPSLLSKRLSELARAGVIDRRVDGNEVQYVLTPAGQELRPVVEALGAWGARWIGHLGKEDLDPSLLLWDMHRNVDHSAAPKVRTVVHFQFSDVPARSRRWWLVITPDDVDVCDTDPGYDVSVTVIGSLSCMTQIWRGDLSWPDALRAGTVVLHGPSALCRALPHWFTSSRFASITRAPQYLPAPNDTGSWRSMT